MIALDFRGSPLEVGDFVVRLADNGHSMAGYIKGIVGGRDRRTRALICGVSKRPILTESLSFIVVKSVFSLQNTLFLLRIQLVFHTHVYFCAFASSLVPSM